MPTITAGGTPQTINLPEGRVLNIVGAPGTTGVVYRLDPTSGGTNSLQSWSVGAGALVPIGPFVGLQRFLVTCSTGSVDVAPGSTVSLTLRSAGDVPGLISTPGGNAIPAWYRSRATSLMALGDSLTAQGLRLPILPPGGATRPLNQVITNMNAGGLFIVLSETDTNCPVGTGSVRYYAASRSLSWQAFGDTEGPRVVVPTSGFYKLPSGTDGAAMYVGVVGRLRPTVDKVDAINNSGILRMNSQCGIFGPVPWLQALMGSPYKTILGYAIPSIRASDWLEAVDQWRGVYTDVTRIALGTNDVTDRASAIATLAVIDSIIQIRLAIGSRPYLVALTPYDTRPAAATAAVTEFNQGLRVLGARYNIDVAEPWAWLAAPAGTGGYVAGMASDGLHFGNKGGYIVAARSEVDIHRKYVNPKMPTLFANSAYNAVTAPYGNLLVNPQMTGVAGTPGAGVVGEIPNSWAVVRDGASTKITAVCRAPDSANAVSRIDKRPGKYFTVEISNVDGVNGEAIRVRPAAFITAGFSPSDLLALEGDVVLQGAGIQFLFIETVLDNNPGAVSYSAAAIGTNTAANAALGDLGGDAPPICYDTSSAPVRVDPGITRVITGIVVGMLAGGTATLHIGANQNLHKVAP